ncbi:MAG: prolipoprotein diacylglyceryl transferase [Candidatus Acidiferrales bacterium]
MHPILFHYGAVTIYSYGVLVATGVLLGLWYARRQAPRAGLDPERIWNLGIYMVLTALIVAKVWLVLSSWDFYMANPREIFSLNTFQSGGTFYGGFVGALALVAAYTYVQRMSIVAVLDTFAAGLPLGHAIGRLGCFAAGCCYGKPTTAAWGVTFKNPAAAQLAGTPLGVKLHPTELYEAAAEFLNFLILVWLGKRQTFRGQMMATYFILYGVERGLIEFVRGDPGRTMLWNGSVSLMQLVSVALVVIGAIVWWRGLRGQAPGMSATNIAGARRAPATAER